MILSTKTIELRSFISQKDNIHLKEKYLAWLSDIENIELINSFGLYIKPSTQFIDESFQRFTCSTCQGFFIYDTEHKEYLGTVKLDKIDLFRRSAEIGIMIGERTSQGKKIGSQCMEIILDFGFNTLGLYRIWGGTSEFNSPMIRLFEKYSFQNEGRFRSANYIQGKYSDNLYFGLLCHERNL
jgi:RimJ/RimL family protein N-acetyltransferase